MPETFNEQLVLHDWEHDVCTRAYPFLAALGAIRLQDEVERVGRDAGLPHEWKLGWKKHGDKRHRTRITFEGIDYSDGKSKDGTAKIFDLPSEGLGWSRTYNAKAIPVDEEINEEIDASRGDSEDLNANFNVTNRTYHQGRGFWRRSGHRRGQRFIRERDDRLGRWWMGSCQRVVPHHRTQDQDSRPCAGWGEGARLRGRGEAQDRDTRD